jgi:hypothetical protein
LVNRECNVDPRHLRARNISSDDASPATASGSTRADEVAAVPRNALGHELARR